MHMGLEVYFQVTDFTPALNCGALQVRKQKFEKTVAMHLCNVVYLAQKSETALPLLSKILILPFLVAALLLVGRLATLARILTYSYSPVFPVHMYVFGVQLQIDTRKGTSSETCLTR